MILKEAYRYQNFLTNLISNAQTYLGSGSFVMTTTQRHMKSKANPEATDDDLEVPKSYNVDFTPIQLVDFLMDTIQEKQKLSDAIAEAKKNTEIDLDSSYAMNKTKQSLAKVFKTMAGRKATETEKLLRLKSKVEIIDSMSTRSRLLIHTLSKKLPNLTMIEMWSKHLQRN